MSTNLSWFLPINVLPTLPLGNTEGIVEIRATHSAQVRAAGRARATCSAHVRSVGLGLYIRRTSQGCRARATCSAQG